MNPLTFVCWKWPPTNGYRSTFGPETVNVLGKMIARNYPEPHRFCCVTSETRGLNKSVEVIKPWNDFAHVPSPSGGRNPSCYRRLRAFHPDIEAVFGPRFVSLDLDVVITADIRPLFDRPEDFMIWGDTNPRTFYNGSIFMLKAGARPQVWTTFNPATSPRLARDAGHFGSDQGWISKCLGPNEAKWTTDDGVYSYRNHIRERGGTLPENARIVVFHGLGDPWSPEIYSRVPWVREAYR